MALSWTKDCNSYRKLSTKYYNTIRLSSGWLFNPSILIRERQTWRHWANMVGSFRLSHICEPHNKWVIARKWKFGEWCKLN